MIKNPIPWPNGAKCAVAITFDMDADSLIRDPAPALRQFCEFAGVPYEPAMLRWEANAPPPSWRDLADFEDWLDGVLNSTGWATKPDLPHNPQPPDGEEGAGNGTRELQAALIDENMPVYNRLKHLATQQ